MARFFSLFLWLSPWLDRSNELNYSVLTLFIGEVRSAPRNGLYLRDRGCIYRASTTPIITRVTKTFLALGTTQINSYFTKNWTKFLTHQTGNYPVTCFVSKPSRITLVVLSIINTSYQKLPFGSGDYPDKLLFHQPNCVYISKENLSRKPTIRWWRYWCQWYLAWYLLLLYIHWYVVCPVRH